MAEITLKTKYFEELDFSIGEDFGEHIVADFGAGERSFWVYVDEEAVTKESLSIVKRFLDNADELYKKAIGYIKAHYKEEEGIVSFIHTLLDDVYEDLIEFYEIEEIDEKGIIDRVELTSLWFSKNDKGNKVCVHDFRMKDDFCDEVIAVRFDENFEVISVSHES